MINIKALQATARKPVTLCPSLSDSVTLNGRGAPAALELGRYAAQACLNMISLSSLGLCANCSSVLGVSG